MSDPILERTDDLIHASPRDRSWELTFDARRGAALDALTVNGRMVARRSSFYVDDVPDAAGVPGRSREFRRTGAAVVSGATVLPVGAEVGLARTWRIAGNHARVTADLKWPRGAPVQRHFGLDGLLLPGEWTTMHCIPPLQHMIEGAAPSDRDLPEFGGERVMIAHWHRPPLAIVLRDAAGFAVEVGTGDDVWRWEQSLGYGPESGSYKLFRVADGVEFVREPLMCCEEFEPAGREYRFTWHLAWSGPAMPVPDAEAPAAEDGASVADLDLDSMDWHHSARRRGLAGEADGEGMPCFAGAVAQKAFRRRIRQLAEAPEPGGLSIHGIGPGPCVVPAHVRRGAASADLPHWDLHALMALSEWSRQTLGPDWSVRVTPRGIGRDLPSVQGLFRPSGFELIR